MLFGKDWLPVARSTWTKLANDERSASHSTCHMAANWGESRNGTTHLGERTLRKAANAACTTTPLHVANLPNVLPCQQNCRTSNKEKRENEGEGEREVRMPNM